MRSLMLIAGTMAVMAGPAFAQTPHHPNAMQPQSGEKPIDTGPFTPEASSAYQGGGVVLQGAPGAPAPKPEPTPPGQMPRNMVPQ